MLYTPYDTYLDRVSNEGIISINDEYNNKNMDKTRKKNIFSNNNKIKSNAKKTRGKSKNKSLKATEEYESGLSPLIPNKGNETGKYNLGNSILAFHRRYVKDLNVDSERINPNRTATRMSANNKNVSNSKKKKKNDQQSREVRRKMAGVTYAVPQIDIDEKGKFDSTMLVLTRSLILERLEALLWLERHETRRNELKSVSLIDRMVDMY